MNTTPIARTVGAVVDFAPGAGTTIEFSTSPTLVNGILGISAPASGTPTSPTPSTGAVDFATVTGAGPFVVAPMAPATRRGLATSGSGHGDRQLSQQRQRVDHGGGGKCQRAQTHRRPRPSPSAANLTLGPAANRRVVLFDDSTGAATIAAIPAFTLGAADTEMIVIMPAGTRTPLANALTISAPIGRRHGAP